MRRLPLLWAVALPLLLGLGSASAQSLPKPSWLQTEPLIIVGSWDDMAIFRRRVGGNPVWQEEDYARSHTEDAVRKLKELGVTMAVIHFFKGFGLEAEREHQEDARKVAAWCKKYGLRVGVYIGSTIGFEAFLIEKPDAESWFVRPFLGRPVLYGDQTFRKRVYFMHPGYREYIRRVLKLAVEEFQVDLIHFDNTSLQAQAPVFLHPQAVEDFRAFLRKKYSPEMLKKRFGISDVRYMEPPEIDQTLSQIDDPMVQEWADFRSQQLTDYYAGMRRYIRAMNPEVAVESNPHSGMSGVNTVWQQGIDYPRLLAHMDVVWTEEGNEAGVSPDGILISKIRTYKMAALLKNKIFTYTAGGRGDSVALAEAMAYNRQCLGMVGGALAGYQTPQNHRDYIQFYRKNFEHYRDVESRADVAVLQSFASMAYNNDLPWQSAMLLEQALIQAKVPFDIIFDDQLKDLGKYRVLALPDQECLTEQQMELIRQYVKGGGGLVATELASLYTEWRQRRREFGLGDLFGVRARQWSGAREPDRTPEGEPVRREVGRGRVAYFGSVRPAIAKPPGASMTSRYWKLPVNWRELVAAVKWAAQDNLSLEVKAPLTVTAELLEQKAKGKLLVHLINYDAERTPEVANVEVSVEIPAGKHVSELTLLSPDEPKPTPLAHATERGRAVFMAPSLKTYAVAVAQLAE